MRIWFQSSIDYSIHPQFVLALESHFKRIGSPGTEVTLHGMDPDIGHRLPQPDIIESPAVFMNTVVRLFLRNAVKAERDGYDAFVVGSYAEPALRELKSITKIPVVSATESTLLTACTVAPRIGFVTLSKLVIPFLQASAERHGLAKRISGIHLVDEIMLETTLDKQFDQPQVYLDKFTHAAQEAIAAGADAIIPAEAMVAAIVAVNGLTEIEGVPIIDGVGTPILAAESAVIMRSRLGIQPSRRVAYPLPSEAARKAVLEAL